MLSLKGMESNQKLQLIPPRKLWCGRRVHDVSEGKRKHRIEIHNVVANLSSKPLNSAESSLLSNGLRFCPNPPKINARELDEDLDQFARRFRIKEYFHSKKDTSEDISIDESDIKEVK